MKRLFIFFTVVFFAVFVHSETRSREDASNIAADFSVRQFKQSGFSSPQKVAAVAPTLLYTAKDNITNNPYYYVFSNAGNEGFVIISGDMRAEEVLAYSDKGNFDLNNMPSNMRDYLLHYENEMAALCRLSAAEFTANAEVQRSARGMSKAPVKTKVLPLLGAMQWNQGEPYNDLCPVDNTGNKSVSGCVATAMAQIMAYHKWPIRGNGSNYYVTNNQELSVGADFSLSTYDWENMTSVYDEYSTMEENRAVALLMRDCGLAVDMDYTAYESAAYSSNVDDALVEYFGYDGDIRYLDKNKYSYREWVDIFKAELSEDRPIYHSGASEGGGHAFVCDGYDENDYFHFNWGWGGYQNGYFKLSALDPATGGIGAGTADGYNQWKSIIIGIQPEDHIDNSIVYIVMTSDPSVEVGAVHRDSSFIYTLNDMWNKGTGIYNGGIYFALYNEDGVRASDYIGDYVSDLGVGWGWYNYNILFEVVDTIPVGNYRIYAHYATDTTLSELRIVNNRFGRPNYMDVELTADSIIFSGAEGFDPELNLLSLQATSNLYTNRVAQFKFKIKNEGIEYASDIDLRISNIHDIQTFTNPALTILSGDTVEITLTEKIDLPVGTYSMQMLYDATNSESDASTPLGTAVSVTVQAEPTQDPALALVNKISFADNDMVPVNGAELNFTLTNTGGYSATNVVAYIFPESGGYSLANFGKMATFVGTNEVKNYTLTGDIDLPAGRYVIDLRFYGEDGSLMFFDYDNAQLYFTLLSDGSMREVADFDAFEAFEDTENLVRITSDMTAIFQNYYSLYVWDGTDVELLYGDYISNSGIALENGQRISNVVGKYSVYNDVPQMQIDTIETVGSVGIPMAARVMDPAVVDEEDMNQYVRFEGAVMSSNVTYVSGGSPQNGSIVVGSNTMTVRSQFRNIDIALLTGDVVNVEGFVSKFSGAYQLYITSIEKANNQSTIPAPAFSNASGNYTDAITVTLDASNYASQDSCVIVYSVGGEEPNVNEAIVGKGSTFIYEGPLTVSRATTIKAQIYNITRRVLGIVGTVTYTFTGEIVDVVDFDAFETLADSENSVRILDDMTAIFQNDMCLYVWDGSDVELLYGEYINNSGIALANGQTISDVVGKYSIYNDAPQMLIDTIETIGTIGAAIEPELFDIWDLSINDMNQYVRLENLYLLEDISFTEGIISNATLYSANSGESIIIRSQFRNIEAVFTQDQNLSVEGFVSQHNGDLRLYVTKIETIIPASMFEKDGLWYSKYYDEDIEDWGDEVELIESYIGEYAMDSVVIPSTVENDGMIYNVISIGDLCFYQNSYLEYVSIPGTIKRLTFGEFAACPNLKEVVFNEGIEEIGNQAFLYSPSLTNVTIPSTVSYLGYRAFNNCTLLDSIVVLGIEPPATDEDVFGYLPNTHKLYVPQQSLYEYMTADTWKDMNIVFPDGGVGTKFKDGDYWYQILKTLPREVRVIACQDSSMYAIANVNIPSTVMYDGDQYNVVSIYDRAFNFDIAVASVTLPSTMKRVEDLAFAGCENITALNFNEGLEFIGESAFMNLYHLEKLTLPSTLKEIGNWAFHSPFMLDTINVLAVVPPVIMNPYVFYNLPADHIVNIPAGTAEAYSEALCWQDMNLNVPEGNVGSRFQDGDYWYVVTDNVNNEVRVVKPNSSVYTLTDVNVPSTATNTANHTTYSVTEIGLSAFSNMDSLKTAFVPSSVKYIEQWAFSGNPMLHTVTLSEGLDSIGVYAFYTTALGSITLPSTLKKLRIGAFSDCNELVFVHSKALVPPVIENDVFDNNIGNTLRVAPASIFQYQSTEGWNVFSYYDYMYLELYSRNDTSGMLNELFDNKLVVPTYPLGMLPTPELTNHRFDGWTIDGVLIEESTICNFEWWVTAEAQWTELSNATTYTVEHYQENEYNSSYTLVDTETFTVDAGEQVTPGVRTYTGFVSPLEQTVTVAAGGGTVVTYNYNRTRHTVTYVVDADFGTSIGTLVNIDVKYGAPTPTAPVVVVNEGYEFNGWYPTLVATVTEDAIYTAQFSAKYYTLSFNLNGGVGATNDISVAYGSAIGTLPVVSKDNYTFVSWKIDGEDINANKIWRYTDDKVAVAEWLSEDPTMALYTVYHMQENVLDDNYTEFAKQTFTASVGSQISPSVNTYAGFTSPAVQTDSVAADGSTEVVYEYDRTLHAVTYVVDAEKGTSVGTLVNTGIKYGAATPEVPMVTALTGYKFVGWSPALAQTVEGDATYTAQFTNDNQYILTFNLAGGSGVANNITVTTGEAIGTLPVVTRSGYSFVEWQIDGVGITASTVWTYTDDKLAIATWQKVVSTTAEYKVFHMQQNIYDDAYTLFAQETLSGTIGEQVMPAVNVYAGFTSPAVQTVTIVADGSAQVVYNYNRKLYTVAYVVDESKCNVSGQLVYNNVKHGAATPYAPTIMELPGYKFTAWDPNWALEVTRNATYTAQFSAKEYTLSFDLNGGSSAATYMEVVYGTEIGDLPEASRDGYIFMGWEIDGDSISASTVWTWADDKVAVAKWTEVKTGVDGIDNRLELRLYPNPVESELNVDIDAVVSAVTIYNALGALVMRVDDESGIRSIDVMNLPYGHYLLRVELEDGLVVNKRFIKI